MTASTPKASSRLNYFMGVVFALIELISFIIIGLFTNGIFSFFLFIVFVLLCKLFTQTNPKKLYVGFFFILFISLPFLYATFLLASIKGIGFSLLFIYAFLFFLFWSRNHSFIQQHYHQQQHWLDVTLEFPENVEIIYDEIKPFLANDLKSTIHLRHCILKFPIEYEIHHQLAQIDNFHYHWSAPHDNPTQHFNYNTELKDHTFQLKCNPDNIEHHCSLLSKERLDLIIRQSIQNRNRYYLLFLPIVLLAILLIIKG